MNRILKWAIAIVILVAAVGVIFYSGMFDFSELNQPGDRFDANGVTFQYPSTWEIGNPVAEGAIAAVVKENDTGTNIIIQQVPESFGNDIQNASEYNEQYLQQSTSYVNIQMVNSSINGQPVVMHRYLINDDTGLQKEHVATWIKLADDKLYVILLSTTPDEYESQRSNYDLVAGTFGLSTGEKTGLEAVFNRGG